MHEPIKDPEKYWTAYALRHLVNRRIVKAEYLTQTEADELGWYGRPLILTLDNGTQIYPQQDEEGNGPGCLAGVSKNGKEELLFPEL